MKSYSRPYSNDNWEPAEIPRVKYKTMPAKVGLRHVDFQFDTAPDNNRSRVASLELTVNDMIEHAAHLMGGRATLIAHIAAQMQAESVDQHEALRVANAQLREKDVALENVNEKLKSAQRMRAIGGAL